MDADPKYDGLALKMQGVVGCWNISRVVYY